MSDENTVAGMLSNGEIAQDYTMPSPFPNHTVRLHGLHLHFIVKDEVTGVETEGAIHLQHTGKVGISKPYWAHSYDVATKAMPVLEAAYHALRNVAEDPSRWPTFEQESQGRGHDPVPDSQEE